jgi:hypothetical protein
MSSSSVSLSDDSKSLTIAIDFGGVLSVHDAKNDTGSEHHNVSINMEGALEALVTLKKAGHKLYLVSFCGRRRAVETMESINTSAPGIFDGLYFVKDKAYKKHICAYLGADVMIDDTLPILVDIAQNAEPRQLILFSGDPGFKTQGNTRVLAIAKLDSWSRIVELCATLKPSHKPAWNLAENLSKWVYLQ